MIHQQKLQSNEESSFNYANDNQNNSNLEPKHSQNKSSQLQSLDLKYNQLAEFITNLPSKFKGPVNIGSSNLEIEVPQLEESVSGERLLQFASNTIRKMKNHKRLKKNWNRQDLTILLWVINKYNAIYSKQTHKYTEIDWDNLSQFVPGKTGSQCMFKWLSLKKHHLTEHPWTLDQQMDLKRLVEQKGQSSWPQISQQLYSIGKARIFRSAKQCREHWTCYVNPNLKKGLWRPQQDLQLLSQFIKLGKKWAQISKVLNGRTQNAIKNRFNLLMQKEGQMKGNPNPINRRDYALKIIRQIQANSCIPSKFSQNIKIQEKKQYIKSQQIKFIQREPSQIISYNRRDNFFPQSPRPIPSNHVSQYEVKVQNQQQSIVKKVKFCKVSLQGLMQMQGVIPAIFDRDTMEIFIDNNNTG